MAGPAFIDPAEIDPTKEVYLGADIRHANDDSRGVKRSRTPDSRLGAEEGSDDEDAQPRKRGRITKGSRPPSPPTTNGFNASVTHTPQLQPQSLPQDSPSQPPIGKATPVKPLSKALAPLNITTDQLCEDRSGFTEIQHDEEGEKKVTETGHLTRGRSYRCRTFHLPEREHKLFMLATECARVLVFRDSYLLFNKNKSLFKIIATTSDKEGLIEQGILPYSYRSRQIALVTARSMYRQFGAKMIVDGRKVKDDYWEDHARAQGYTEDDYAVERKVAPQKVVKETAGTDVSSVGATAMNTLAQGEIVFQKPQTGNELPPPSLEIVVDVKPSAGDYGNIPRPIQDIVGAPYEDRIQPSQEKDIVDHAAQASQFNQACAEGAKNRREFFKDYYLKPREVEDVKPPAAATPRQPEALQPPMSQYRPSPHQRRESQSIAPAMQQQLQHQMSQQQTPTQMHNQQAFARPQHPNMSNHVQASPAPSQHSHLRRDSTSSHMSQPQHRPSFPYSNQTPTPTGGGQMFNPYNQPQGNAMWPSQHAQQIPSPHNQPHPQQQMGGQPFKQSPHQNMQNMPGMQGSPGPMNFGGQRGGQGMGALPQGYPRIPQGMFQGGQNPAQALMQQQQQMGHNHHGMMAAQGMQGFPGGMGQPQQQQMGMGQWTGGY